LTQINHRGDCGTGAPDHPTAASAGIDAPHAPRRRARLICAKGAAHYRRTVPGIRA